MAEFTLKPKETETLRLNIGEESYQIPLAGSLTRKELVPMDTDAGTYAFFCKHIPKKLLESLKLDDYNQIVNVWRKESQKVSGMNLGE